jgi:hypothetical protein
VPRNHGTPGRVDFPSIGMGTRPRKLVGIDNPFFHRLSGRSISLRGQSLAALGNGLAWEALNLNGFGLDAGPSESKELFGTLLAAKDGKRYIFHVATRRKFKQDGTPLNRYRLAARYAGRLAAIARASERKYLAKAHWITVQIDEVPWLYCVYVGSICQLQGGESVLMGSSYRYQYTCLAFWEGIPMQFDRMTPTEIKRSIRDFKSNHPDPSKTAFIMMRFSNTSAHKKIVHAIRSVLRSHGIEALRADEKDYHDDLFWNIITYIYGCGFGIAVYERLLTDEFNPNVALEVGYMLALGKQVCLLKDETLRHLHTDLAGKLYRQFNPQNSEADISKQLEKWARDRDIIPPLGSSPGTSI